VRNKNICKFSTPSLPEGLTVFHFVLETNSDTMRCESTLPRHRMLLCLSGEGEAVIGDSALALRAGSLLFVFDGERFRIARESELSYMYIDFSGARGDTLLRRFGIDRVNSLFDGMEGLLPLWSESLARASSETVDLAAESTLLLTFSRLFGSVSERSGLVGRIVQLTEEHFADPGLGVSALAAELSYNPKYLSHAFKERMGIGYAEYLRSVRIRYAISLFDRGLDSVKNVALLSGFTDPLYFSSIFRRAVGLSPKEYVLAAERKRKENTQE